MIVDENYLDDRLASLENAAAWSPRALSRFENFLRTAEDAQLFKIDPLQYAREKHLGEREAVDLFLHATRLGLLDIQWGLVCPMCGDTVESFASLRQVDSHFHCSICEIDTVAALDDYIMISFMVSPRVRRIAYHTPESLGVVDYWQHYRFNRQWRLRNGTPITTMFTSGLKGLQGLAPGEQTEVTLPLTPGFLKIFNLSRARMFTLPVLPDGTGSAAAVALDYDDTGAHCPDAHAEAGPVTLHLRNNGNEAVSLAIANIEGDPKSEGVHIDPFFTAGQLLNSQTFRNLFSTEVILATDGIGIKDVTLLFTDLKGSTAMYDRIGDLQAFALVRQHFESLTGVVGRHRGAIVKTIGDAVMATFRSPEDGVRAALDMLEEIRAFNAGRGCNDLILKVGLHHGAAIAVTLNERLDYFGQTVNIAARVQGLADEDEIYVTRDIHDAPGVADALRGFAVTPERSRLKGIAGEVLVYRISVRPGAAS